MNCLKFDAKIEMSSILSVANAGLQLHRNNDCVRDSIYAYCGAELVHVTGCTEIQRCQTLQGDAESSIQEVEVRKISSPVRLKHFVPEVASKSTPAE